jgi:ABC-type sugar transport system substrate-binding protein
MDTRRPRLWLRMLLVAVIALALAVGFAACGDDDDDEGGGGGGDSAAVEDKRVYLNAYAQEIQYFRDWHDGATARAKELGWRVESEYGNGTPEQQVQQIQNQIVKQPDAILLTAIDEKSPEPVLRQAKDGGAQIITIGGTVADDSLLLSFVSRDNYGIGKQKAEYVVDQLGGKGTVGIVHGIRGLTFSQDQARGYEDVLSKESGIEVIDGGYAGGFSGDLGLDKTSSLLTRNPDVDAIIYDNDDLALGGAEALQERNIDLDDVLILGTDGGKAALDAVEKGTLDMTISLCGFREGASAVDVLAKFYGTEQPPPKRVLSKVEVFTTENAKEKRQSLSREDCA